MPEPSVPRPDLHSATTGPRRSPDATVPPMPWDVTTVPDGTVPLMPSEVTTAPDGTVPLMPSEVTRAQPRTPRPVADVFRAAMSPLRKMMHRAPRHA